MDEDACVVCDGKFELGDFHFSLRVPILVSDSEIGELEIKAHKKCWARYANLKQMLGQGEVRL